MKGKLKNIGAIFALMLVLAGSNALAASSQTALTVAVAANFILPMEELVACFIEKNSTEVHTVYSSTGKLYAQIIHGAPYDVFLAADSWRPQMLVQKKKSLPGFLYAKGQTVLWAKRKAVLVGDSWQEAILKPKVMRIGIASPQAAPYGEAAAFALKKSNLWPMVETKLVYGQSVAQAFMFCQQGGVDLSFIALSQALSPYGLKGDYLSVPEAPLIMQKGCVLTRSSLKVEAQQFVDFILSKDGQTIINRYGYQ